MNSASPPIASSRVADTSTSPALAPSMGQDDGWQATMCHIALEGRVAVISAVIANRTTDVPADLPGRDELYPADQWLCPGGSVIVDGDGSVLAGPLYETEGILVADFDIDRLDPTA